MAQAPAAPGTPPEVPKTQTTYYGYEQPGDENYDPGSASGLGDRQNKLVPGLSVALSQPERQARFGVSGKSTGQTFTYEGRTWRDDDSTSYDLTNRRVDIFNPQGPSTPPEPSSQQPTQQTQAQSDLLSHQTDAFFNMLSQPDFELVKDSGPHLGGHLGAINA